MAKCVFTFYSNSSWITLLSFFPMLSSRTRSPLIIDKDKWVVSYLLQGISFDDQKEECEWHVAFPAWLSATCTDTQLKETGMPEALGPWLYRCGTANIRIWRDKWFINSSHCRLQPTIHWGKKSLEGGDCWMKLSSQKGAQQEVSDACFSEWKPTKPSIKISSASS